jgi:hypothetical protein
MGTVVSGQGTASHDMERLTMNLFPKRGVCTSFPATDDRFQKDHASKWEKEWEKQWRDCQHHRPPSRP